MNNRIRVLVGLIGVSASAWAYEVDTHAVIADRAFDGSVLAQAPSAPTVLRGGM